MTDIMETIKRFLDDHPDYRYLGDDRFLLLRYLDREIGTRYYHSTWIEPFLRKLGKKRGIDYLNENSQSGKNERATRS